MRETLSSGWRVCVSVCRPAGSLQPPPASACLLPTHLLPAANLGGHEPCGTTDPPDSEPAGLRLIEDLRLGTVAEGGDGGRCEEILPVLRLKPDRGRSTLEGQDIVPSVADKPIAAHWQEKSLCFNPPEEAVAPAPPALDQALTVEKFERGIGRVLEKGMLMSHVALRLFGDGGDKGKTSPISKRVDEI